MIPEHSREDDVISPFHSLIHSLTYIGWHCLSNAPAGTSEWAPAVRGYLACEGHTLYLTSATLLVQQPLTLLSNIQLWSLLRVTLMIQQERFYPAKLTMNILNKFKRREARVRGTSLESQTSQPGSLPLQLWGQLETGCSFPGRRGERNTHDDQAMRSRTGQRRKGCLTRHGLNAL